MKSELFLDASYAIALTAPGDHHHRRAVELSEQIEAERVRLTTHREGGKIGGVPGTPPIAGTAC
jgi:hypothetical protein